MENGNSTGKKDPRETEEASFTLSPEEKKARGEAERKALRRKKRKRWRKAFGFLLLRIVVLAVVLYVLFFQLVGVTTMPNGDMYPRIDAGDLVLFYRLDKEVQAQDIVVFEKDSNYLQEYVDRRDASEEDLEEDGDEADLTASESSGSEEAADTAETALPGEAAASSEAGTATAPEEKSSAASGSQPVPRADDTAPAKIVSNDGFRARVNRLVYDLSQRLGLRRPEGKQLFICRVVAAEGDTVEVTDDGRLIVNGNSMIESNIFYPTTPYLGFTEYPLTLGPGECFVLADLRNGGADSRFFGPVRVEEILGTVITILRRNNL